jgi:transcription elongation factor Elf1
MFLLLGMRPVDTLLFIVTFVCGHCGTRADQQIVRTQQKVTLFFIPLFSLGTSWNVQCSHCGMVTRLTRQQAEHSMDWAASHGIPVS